MVLRWVSLGLWLVGCDRPPSTDLREWSPADHDRAEESARAAEGARPGSADKGALIVAAAYREQCASCHGESGRGDGPSAALFHAPDLSKDDLQGRLTDEDIARVIAQGKGKMPAFSLPEPVVKGLVLKVRSFSSKGGGR